MKRLSVLIGALLFVAPAGVFAASNPVSLFTTIYDDTKTDSLLYPNKRVSRFVIDQMRRWGDGGVVFTEDDVRDALDSPGSLCTGKTKVDGTPIVFTYQQCLLFQHEVTLFVRSEHLASELGRSLVALTDGAELSVADEGNRPVNMARTALQIRRVWSGNAANMIPWNAAANPQLAALDAALAATSDVDLAVARYRYGYFRELREGDPSFTGVASAVAPALADLARALSISGDQTLAGSGEFVVPLLKTPNVMLWARKDDLGLAPIYPLHYVPPVLKAAGAYPSIPVGGKNLAYPFSYAGSTPTASRETPLCSRTVGRQGYLCRPLPPGPDTCPAGADHPLDEISLVKCDEKTVERPREAITCENVEYFKDNGFPLVLANISIVNPFLPRADTKTMCQPGQRVLYQDDITHHACYVSYCLLQSMSGHTLIPNRDTTLVNEATSPYLACMRADPQLGKYVEVSRQSPEIIPRYQGHELVRDFEQEYCIEAGRSPSPILGTCTFREESRLRSQIPTPTGQTAAVSNEAAAERSVQDAFTAMAASIGQRAALVQSAEAERKVFVILAGFIRQSADLLLELKRAPLTKAQCPWTGPMSSSSGN